MTGSQSSSARSHSEVSESSKSSDRRSERGRHDRRREEERRKEKEKERDGKDRGRSSSRSRSQRRSRSPRRSRSRTTRGPSPRGTSPATEKFAVDREKGRSLRAMMNSKLAPSEARRLRERYVPEFASGSFGLVCPVLDSSMARRLKEMKNAEATKAEAREKSLLADQYKILDIGRPLLFLWNDLTKDQTMLDSPLAVAAASAMQLWGNSFFAITSQRRENVLKTTDPKFSSLLAETGRFCKKETGSLFGRTFLKKMVEDADDDHKLRSIGRGGTSSRRPYSRERGGFNRGGGNSGRGGGYQPYGKDNGFNKDNFRGGGRYVTVPIYSPVKIPIEYDLNAVVVGLNILRIFGRLLRGTLGFWKR